MLISGADPCPTLGGMIFVNFRGCLIRPFIHSDLTPIMNENHDLFSLNSLSIFLNSSGVSCM